MDNGYREIKEDEGAVVEAGDQIQSDGDGWTDMPKSDFGLSYSEFTFDNGFEYRRPIAQDEPKAYATDTKAIVAHALDATANAPDESEAAIKTLANLGYTYHGGELWKPPIGKPPEYITESQWLPEVVQDWKDGWPTVGKECEKLWDQDTGVYYRVNVIAQDYNNTIFRWLEGPSKGGLSESFVGVKANGMPIFRPIKTPEQLAAEERDFFVDKVSNMDSHSIYNWLMQSGVDLSPLTKKDKGDE